MNNFPRAIIDLGFGFQEVEVIGYSDLVEGDKPFVGKIEFYIPPPPWVEDND